MGELVGAYPAEIATESTQSVQITDQYEPQLVFPEGNPTFDSILIASNAVPKPKAYGGLVTGLKPISENGKYKVLWAGTVQGDEKGGLEEALRTKPNGGITIIPVVIDPDVYTLYYEGYANGTLWGLNHGFLENSNTTNTAKTWDAYRYVNKKFAETLLANSTPNDFLWFQDYHLELAGLDLENRKKGFFLHIPQPEIEVFSQLPQAAEITYAMIHYDLLGFHTKKDRNNFLDAVKVYIPDAEIRYRTGSDKKGNTVEKIYIVVDNHLTRIGDFPISIDPEEFERQTKEQESIAIAEEIRRDFPDQFILFNVARLDYTKGFPEGDKGFYYALQEYPELQNNITLIQAAPGSREEIEAYKKLKKTTETRVKAIKRIFEKRSNKTPLVHYPYGLDRPALIGHYMSADGYFVPVLRDGMNLVSKEGPVCGKGVPILSKFAGAAAELGEYSILFDPHDPYDTAKAIYRAYNMTPQEKEVYNEGAKRVVKSHTVFDWADDFIQAGEEIGSFSITA